MINISSLNSYIPKKIYKKRAIRLNSQKKEDLHKAAEIIKSGGIVAFPFNGIYGLFGDVDNKQAAQKIYKAKNRPLDKKLIMVASPEILGDYANIGHLTVPYDDIVNFWKEIHALGVILPSQDTMPVTIENDGTILTIWTEYAPLRYLFDYFRKLGGKAFVGTSANKSGKPTHYESATLWQDFGYDVEAIIEADFSHLEPHRKKSTTVIDMTNNNPRLHRVGNVTKEELIDAMKKYNLPDLTDEEPLIIVKGRNQN